MMSGYYLLRVNCYEWTVAFVGDDACEGPATTEWGCGNRTSCGGIAPSLSFLTTFVSSSYDAPPYAEDMHYTSLDSECSGASRAASAAVWLWRWLLQASSFPSASSSHWSLS
jgi:hypothetical protein